MGAATPDYYEGHILPVLPNALQNCWSVLNNVSFKFLARKRSRQIKKCEDYGRPFVTIFNNSFIKPFNCNSTVQFNPNSTPIQPVNTPIQPFKNLFNYSTPNSTIQPQFNYLIPIQLFNPNSISNPNSIIQSRIQPLNPAFSHSTGGLGNLAQKMDELEPEI